MFSKYRNLPAKLSLASKQCRAFFPWIIAIVSHELFPHFEQEKSWFERKNAQEDPIFSACGAHPGTLTHILHYAFCDTGCRTYITLTTSRRPLRQMPNARQAVRMSRKEVENVFVACKFKMQSISIHAIRNKKEK